MRVGLIGCGLVMELKHMAVLPTVSGIEVAAAADLDERKLAHVADAFGIPKRFTDVAELLACDDVDAVGICTEPSKHMELVLAAIDAGKHVLVEKPLALDLDECDRMIERARGYDSTVMVGHHMRWHRQVRRAREIVRAGGIGTIEAVRGVWTSPTRYKRTLPAWRDDRETGGGTLMEEGVHLYDTMRFALDTDFEEVFTVSRSGRWPDETVSVNARLAGGVPASIVVSELTACDMEFDIYGREGRLRLGCLRYDGFERWELDSVPGGLRGAAGRFARGLFDLPRGIVDGPRGGDYLMSYRSEWEHFARAVAGGTAVDCSLEDGRRSVQVALAAIHSAATGAPVRVADAPRRTRANATASPHATAEKAGAPP